jgi:hypothetical protein
MVVSGFYYVYGIELTPSIYAKINDNFRKIYKIKLMQFKTEEYQKKFSENYSSTLEADVITKFDEQRGFIAFYDDEEFDDEFDVSNTNFETCSVPHRAYRTDFNGSERFFGCVTYYSFGRDMNPFERNITKENELVKFLSRLGIDEKPEYHLIPDDCHCCS